MTSRRDRRTRQRRRTRTRRERLAIALGAAAVTALALGALAAGGALSGTDSPPPPLYCSGGIDAVKGGSLGCIPGPPVTTSTTSGATTSTSSSTTTSTTRPQLTCSGTPTRTLTGSQASAWDAPAPGLTDASGATWRSSTVGAYAVSIFGTTSGATWCGGMIVGPETNPLTAAQPWSAYHDNAGVRFSQPSMTIRNVHSSFVGDAFKPKDSDGGKATHWTLDHVFSDHAYDDCVEDDYLHSGLLTDSWLECYSGFSSRASSGQGTAADGPVTIQRTAITMEPQRNVYKGTVPGTGGWFKNGDGVAEPLSPPFVLRDDVFAAGQLPNHQDLNPPPTLTACSGVRVLWTADSSFPAASAWRSACPDVVIVTGAAARSELAARRAAWLAS